MKLICRINHRTCFFRTNTPTNPLNDSENQQVKSPLTVHQSQKPIRAKHFQPQKKRSDFNVYVVFVFVRYLLQPRISLRAFSHFSRLLNFSFAARVWHNSLWYLKSLFYLIFALNRFFFPISFQQNNQIRNANPPINLMLIHTRYGCD